MLLQLRDFIAQDQFVSTSQLGRAFRLDHSALEPMLDFLVQKGLIKKYVEPGACQSRCRKCSHSGLDYYTPA